MRVIVPTLLFSSALAVHLPPGSQAGNPGEDAEFDYVVVGGGTAGLPLATRLAESGRFSVAVLEAGGYIDVDNGNRSMVPGYDFHSTGYALEGVNPLIDWRFVTEPRANGRSFHYTRGKGFGGTSARNYMIYQRPDRGTMDSWAKAVGDASWAWDSVLPFYKKSASLTAPNMKIRASNASAGFDLGVFGDGPLQVTYPHYASPGASSFLKAFDEVGSKNAAKGFQSGDLFGHGYLPVTSDPLTQERSSAYTSYGKLAREMSGLTTYSRAFVKKIIFDEDKRATGVSVDTAGVTYSIKARKEVIVSAGSIQSPQLLMVSGVGPKAELKKVGVEVVSDRPGVGKNLQDHPMFAVSFPITLESMAAYLANPTRLGEAINEYNEHRTGYLTSPGADAIQFGRLGTEDGLSASIMADLEHTFHPSSSPHYQLCYFAVWYGKEIGSMPPDGDNYASIIAGLIQPQSRGSITLSSADMADSPVIDLGLLSDPTDRAMVAATMRKMRKVLQTKAIAAISREGVSHPAAEVESDEELLAVAIEQSGTFYHAAGTCKMGVESDPMAVVDSRGRVFGVNGLRVVDLSAVPFLPAGQPQATVYMMAEKIADDILNGDGGKTGGKDGHSEL